MPRKQAGTLHKTDDGKWAYRYRDKSGKRPQTGGFATQGEASDALDDALDRMRTLRRQDVRVRDLVDRYLDQHQADPATIAKLRRQLKKATDTFGDTLLIDLEPHELGAWRMKLPEGSRHDVFRAFKQVLEQFRREGRIGEVRAWVEDLRRVLPRPEHSFFL